MDQAKLFCWEYSILVQMALSLALAIKHLLLFEEGCYEAVRVRR